MFVLDMFLPMRVAGAAASRDVRVIVITVTLVIGRAEGCSTRLVKVHLDILNWFSGSSFLKGGFPKVNFLKVGLWLLEFRFLEDGSSNSELPLRL